MPEKCHFKEGNLAARRQLAEFSSFLDYVGYDQERVRFVWLDLQDRGRIQRELAEFERQLSKLSPAKTLATRIPLNEGGAND